MKKKSEFYLHYSKPILDPILNHTPRITINIINKNMPILNSSMYLHL